MQQDIMNGYLDTSDAVTLVNTRNAKQAQMIWAYKVKRSKEKLQQQKMAEINAQNQGTQQAALISQQGAIAQQKQIQEFELKKQQQELQADIIKTKMKIESEERIALASNQTKIIVSNDQSEAKIEATDIQGQHSQIKQQLQNQKPVSGSK